MGPLASPAIVLASNNGDIGGGEIMLLAIAKGLSQLGIRIVVVGPTHDGGVLDAAEEAGHHVVRLAADRRTYYRQLRQWDRTERRGLLWCNGLVPAFATSGHRGRVVHLHAPPVKATHRAAAEVARAGALLTLVPSHHTAQGVPGAQVLWNWNPDIQATVQPRTGDTLRVGFLGRLAPEKGVLVLADAFRQVVDAPNSPAVRLIMAGAPRFVSEDEERMVTGALAPIKDHVSFTGWIEPRDFFGRVDLLVLPSVEPESFGLVVTEAMSARVPFVISDLGALPEIAGPAHPWITPTGDASALAATMTTALNTPEPVRQELIEAARQRWEHHFSPEAGLVRLRMLLHRFKVLP